LQKFQTENTKVGITLATYFQLSVKQSSSREIENIDMTTIPYAFVMDSLMYAMICTKPYIEHVGIINQFLLNPSREHWNAVKWILIYHWSTSALKLCYRSDKPTLVG